MFSRRTKNNAFDSGELDHSSSPGCLSKRGPMMRQAVNYLVAEIGKRAKLRFHVHPHMLRHSTGYYLANRGYDTRLVQDYLGEDRSDLTERHLRYLAVLLRVLAPCRCFSAAPITNGGNGSSGDNRDSNTPLEADHSRRAGDRSTRVVNKEAEPDTALSRALTVPQPHRQSQRPHRDYRHSPGDCPERSAGDGPGHRVGIKAVARAIGCGIGGASTEQNDAEQGRKNEVISAFHS